MSSVVVPKEQLSAYQRWEMAALEAIDSLTVTNINDVASEPDTHMPTPDEIAQIREQARQEGYAAGLEQGRIAGQIAVQTEGEALHAVCAGLSVAMEQANESIAQDVLKLALDVSQAILKTTLDIRPGLVLAAVRDAIHYLPTLQPHAQLFLHPADATLVQQHIGADLAKAGWRIIEAPELERGGCRVETGNNQIDGSIRTRWQRIAAVLGSNTDWLAQD